MTSVVKNFCFFDVQVRIQLDNEIVIHSVGDKAGQLLGPWRLLRDYHPEGPSLLSHFTVMGQHSSTCDSVLANWVSDHIHQQRPDVPMMLITDCLGASWAPSTMERYWLNNQIAIPMAPGSTAYNALPDTHVHPQMKAILRQEKNKLQEHADREFVIAQSEGPYQWGPWETSVVVARTMARLEKSQQESRLLLAGAISTQMLVMRPDADWQLRPLDDLNQPWQARFPRSPCFRLIPQSIADRRVQQARLWQNGEPPVPDWSVLDRLGNYLDQQHHPRENPDDPEDDAVVLDGRFEDLALTPEQLLMLVPLDQRLKDLPRGSSTLVKRAEAAKRIRTKRKSRWAQKFGDQAGKKQSKKWRARLAQGVSVQEMKRQNFGQAAAPKRKFWRGGKKKASTTQAKAEAKPNKGQKPKGPNSVEKTRSENSPWLQQKVRIMSPTSHPTMLGFVGHVVAHWQGEDETEPDQGTLTLMLEAALGKGVFQIHLPVAEVCRCDQLPEHVPVGPPKLNLQHYPPQVRYAFCQELGVNPGDAGLEPLPDQAMSEGTSIHAGQVEIRLRLPCDGLVQLPPAAVEVLSWPAFDARTLSPGDQKEYSENIQTLSQALLVLAPVHTENPQHWTLLSARRQSRDQPWQLEYEDSLPAQTDVGYQAATRIARRLFLLPEGQQLPKSLPGDQKDGWSCGLIVLQKAEMHIRRFRGELPSVPPSIPQIRQRVNVWIQKLHEAVQPKFPQKGQAHAKRRPPPATFEEALIRGKECTKCRPSKLQPVKGCSFCMGRWFEEIRQRGKEATN